MKHGFSLVELSIVLVILGLLAGGIMLGQNLIRNAEVRAVSAEYERFRGAAVTFEGQYRGLPGDLPNATRYWGQAAAGAACNRSTNAGTCDGDGNGLLSNTTNSNEWFRFWQHLQLAGLTESRFTGVSNHSTNDNNPAAGINAPGGKISNSVWFAQHLNHTSSCCAFEHNFGNALIFGLQHPTTWNAGPILTPQETFKLDRKMDDGHATQGSVWAVRWDECVGAANDTDYVDYDLSLTGIRCGIAFGNAF